MKLNVLGVFALLWTGGTAVWCAANLAGAGGSLYWIVLLAVNAALFGVNCWSVWLLASR